MDNPAGLDIECEKRHLKQNPHPRPMNNFKRFEKTEIQQSIPERFEKQVEKYPEKIAVKTKTHRVTYGQLNKNANRIARGIVSIAGRNPEPVALILEHGAPVITGILAVLKAGKIYTPMDPTLPPVRSRYILENSQAKLIVTNKQNLKQAEKWSDNKLQILNIDQLSSSLSPPDNLEPPISPDALAWCLYTSGSTGNPKGVLQSHRNILHFTMNYTNKLHVSPDDNHALLYSCSFSGSATDLFAALLNGASLFPYDLRTDDLTGLSRWLIDEKVTIYHSPPTIFRHFVNTLTGDEKFPRLRVIDICSEPVHKRDVELYKKHFSRDCIFLNRLGATELNVIRMYFLDRDTELYGNIVPVGYGLEDTETLLLDEDGKDVGFNNPGEMVIKSRYLSPGYWERPELNAEKFKSDPEDENIRMYYTGDLGLMLPDGCLFHLGRKDFQVKIRGYRVETAEIEMSLLRHKAIEEAVVAARQDQYGDQHLVAFMVIKEGQKSPTISELREFLEKTLPDYMIPAVFMTLDDIPLTPNGKIDWQALPEIRLDRPELSTPFKPPRTPIEAKLADIWLLVLGIGKVGVQDDFFDLGGHSLLATQVLSRIDQTFGVKIQLETIFQSPTVEEMALIIDQKKMEKSAQKNLDSLLDDIESMSDEDIKRKLQEE